MGVVRKMADDEYLKIVDAAYAKALEMVRLEEGWKVEKGAKGTDLVVESRKGEDGRKVYRCRAKIRMSAEQMKEVIRNTDRLTEWNDTVTESRVLRRINDSVQISYQVTTEAAGGLVSARDFVYLAKTATEPGNVWVMGGCSVECPEAPVNKKLVRMINGAGCQTVTPLDENSCIMVWYMDVQYKGMMPQAIVDVALPLAQTGYVDCCNKLADKLRA